MAASREPKSSLSRNDFDVEAWFARLDSYGDVPFMPEGQNQPPMPEPENIFDDDESLDDPASPGEQPREGNDGSA